MIGRGETYGSVRKFEEGQSVSLNAEGGSQRRALGVASNWKQLYDGWTPRYGKNDWVMRRQQMMSLKTG